MEENYLSKAIEIKNWIENSELKLPPSKKSKDEKEKSLAKDLIFIRKKLIKPYHKLKKDKDIKSFEDKYPQIYEIVKIIQEIDEGSFIQNINKDEQELIASEEEINQEIEKNVEDESTDNFEYDHENEQQSNLANLIAKDIKLRKTIEEAKKLKQKYEKCENGGVD